MASVFKDGRAPSNIDVGLLMGKFKHSGIVSIGNTEYQWHVRHWGGASNAYENQRGLSVSVCAEPGRTKELLVEFAFTDYFFEPPPQQAEFERRLGAAVEAAIEAGWRPLARGKAFVFTVPAKAQQGAPADAKDQRG
jgi:hypothetical protein